VSQSIILKGELNTQVFYSIGLDDI